MARKFTKAAGTTVTAADGEIAGPLVTTVYGSKWAVYADGKILTEVTADDTVVETGPARPQMLTALAVDLLTPAGAATTLDLTGSVGTRSVNGINAGVKLYKGSASAAPAEILQGSGAGKFLLVAPNKIKLGTAVVGGEKYVVAYVK